LFLNKRIQDFWDYPECYGKLNNINAIILRLELVLYSIQFVIMEISKMKLFSLTWLKIWIGKQASEDILWF